MTLEELIADIPANWRLSTLAEHNPSAAGQDGSLWFASLAPRAGGFHAIDAGVDASDAMSKVLQKVRDGVL